MEALARKTRHLSFHAGEFPYRFSSWALDDLENGRAWRDETGEMLAWAVLQIPFESVDMACEPDLESDLLPQILHWVDRRSRARPEIIPLGTPEGKPCWFVNVFANHAVRRHALEEAGFTNQGDMGENSWSKVFMERPADLPVEDYRLPEGFLIRPLAGEEEVEAYVQLHRETFRSNNMTVEWRRRILSHQDYTPDLDLVAATPDGCLAAFCICWLDSHGPEPVSQIEPLGCHPDFRRYALGRLALAEGLRRLHEHGAVKIHVETDNWRSTAKSLYESLGFQGVRDVMVYRKDY